MSTLTFSNTSRSHQRSEPDVLRGLAAMLMLLNHLGEAALPPERRKEPVAAALIFAGSFAPVVFFFVTGVGYGLQSARRSGGRPWSDVLSKIGLLIWADLFMPWSVGRWLGLDFLGFIGISVGVLELVRRTSRSISWCLAGCLAIPLVRFGLGPRLAFDSSTSWISAFLNWIVGFRETPGVSYPLSPWIVYPLLGYILGALAARLGVFSPREAPSSLSRRDKSGGSPEIAVCGPKAPLVFVMLAMIIGILSAWLGQRGASFFRWGTVGIGFFVASFAVLAACLAIALSVRFAGFGWLRTVFSLHGVASLAFVPVHYALIRMTTIGDRTNARLLEYVLLLFATCAVTFPLSRLIDVAGQRLRKRADRATLTRLLILVAAGAAGCTIAWGLARPDAAFAARTIGQLTLCLLFAVR